MLILASPVRWVHLVGGPADLQGGTTFFSYAEKQEKKREQGGQHFSRVGPAPVGPSDATGLILAHM